MYLNQILIIFFYLPWGTKISAETIYKLFFVTNHINFNITNDMH